MSLSARTASSADLYDRLLHRLAVALEQADEQTLMDESHEIELKNLTHAEMELIKAYLQRDVRWLQGWHAAAEELALLDKQNSGSGAALGVPSQAAAPHGPALCCALCATPLLWSDGQTPAACPNCGAQLYRPRRDR